MKVCIAEKPSVAREIAFVIGATKRNDGFFEGNGYAVTWTFGHFCSLYNPHEYKPEWKRWDLRQLPMLPEKFQTRLIDDKGVKKQFSAIKKLFKKATVVINCGDAGQEGELIQRWVLNEAKYKGPVQRLWISSLTREAVAEGFKNLRPASEFDRLYFAGSARAIGDWLLGMNATRLYTVKYGGGKTVLSIGRVQTPTLTMLVKRHKEIESFVSTPFWELYANYRDTDFKYEKSRFTDKEEGEQILQKIKDKPLSVLTIVKKNGKEYAPKLFDLTGLQVNCNKRFGFTADQTLKIAQKLYEQKIISYPRVDTTFLPNDVYPKVKGILQKINGYDEHTRLLLSKPIKKSKRVFNDKKVTDHHAIIPTGVNGNLSGDFYKVYDAIVRRFLANFYPECEVANTTVNAEINALKFTTKGKEILSEGWRVLYPKQKSNKQDNDRDNVKILPAFTEGESGPHNPKLIEKQTKPPQYYTEATLLRAMETAGKTVEKEELRDLMKENGIGRPSTRASIIETLFKRTYAYRSKKLVLASDLGIQLIDTISNPLLKSVELTGAWEKKIRQIESGEYNPAVFIKEMKQMTQTIVNEVKSSNAPSKIDLSAIPDRYASKKSKYNKKKNAYPKTKNTTTKSNTVTKKAHSSKSKTDENNGCPKCKNGRIIKGKAAYGCSNWKTGCELRIPFTFLKKKISDNQIKRLINKGCTVNLKGFSYQNQKAEGLIRFDDNYALVFEPKRTTQEVPKSTNSNTLICPKCKKGNIIKGNTAYGCTNWKTGCNFTYAFTDIRIKANGRTLTKALVKEIIYGK